MLQGIVCKKVNIRSKLTAQKITGFPDLRMAGGIATSEFVQDEFARIASARGADLPEIVGHHFLEIDARSASSGPVKDGFSTG